MAMMTESEKEEFVSDYTKALVTSWSSEDYRERLREQPIEALAEVGLVVPPDSRVEIVTTIPEEPGGDDGTGHLDRQIARWEEGRESGNYRVYIPDTPRIDVSDIDMSDLEDVSAGDVNCCCCPCSCCT